MLRSSTVATELARRLWTEAEGGAGTGSPEAIAAAAEQLCARLRQELGRWIGRDGFHGLLQRALDQARPAYPWLVDLRCEDGSLEDIAPAVRGRGAADGAAGMVTVIAALVQILGRIAGDEMALRLVEHAWAAGASAPATTKTEGESDD